MQCGDNPPLTEFQYDPAAEAQRWHASFDALDNFKIETIAGNPGRLVCVDPTGYDLPVLNGTALRAEVHDGDQAVNQDNGDLIGGGWRAEVLGPVESESDQIFRYTWHTMFNGDYPQLPHGWHPAKEPENLHRYHMRQIWQVFFQWHQGQHDLGSSPPVGFIIEKDSLYFNLEKLSADDPLTSVRRGAWELGPIRRGEWHSFQLDIRWHLTNGLVRLKYNGTQVCFKRQTPGWPPGADAFPLEDTEELAGIPTMFPAKDEIEDANKQLVKNPFPPSVYLKAGHYRPMVQTRRPKLDVTPVELEETALGPYIVYHDELDRCVLKA